jgi:hypothetical protein
MPFREKAAWIKLCAILLVSLMFWLHSEAPFHAMVASVAAYALIEVISRVVLRLRSPLDARQPKDEREQLIELKAIRIAYYVLIAGSLGGIFFPMHVLGNPVMVAWSVFAAFVIAQVVKQTALIYYYRRGI